MKRSRFAVVVLSALAMTAGGTPAWGAPLVGERVAGDGGPLVTPADIRFTPATRLRYGSPDEVQLLAEPVKRMVADARSYLVPTADHPTWPTYAGAVVLAAKDGVIVQHDAVGQALRYSSVGPGPLYQPVELPASEQLPMRRDTLFDLASISKLFTSVVAMQLVERGQLDLDAPVARYIPEFGQNGKGGVTVRMLLTHTSGLPAWDALWRKYPTPEARIAAVYASPFYVDPATGQPATPGGQYIYSDLGLIALGKLVERLAGAPLDDLVRTRITAPLGMHETMYNPPESLRPRIAATEYSPATGRGMVHGVVHDENAWSLDGVAGHAGVFSTASDLAVLCQMLLGGGVYQGARILREDTLRAMLVNYNAPLEERYPESDRGLGFELNKHWYMGALSSPVAFGHTGFTGTTITIDPLSHSFVVFLSNRVHPAREWGGNNPARRAMTRDFGDAMPVRPAVGVQAWRADGRDAATVSLTAPLPAAAADGRAEFQFWYDTEPGFDTARFEVSTDGGTTWTAVPVTLRAGRDSFTADQGFTGYGGRRWWRAGADLPAGTTHVRWTYSCDTNSRGRGVYVDGVVVTDGGWVVFHGERPTDNARFVADGWTPAAT